MRRRLLSLLLSFVMIATLLPISTAAAATPALTDIFKNPANSDYWSYHDLENENNKYYLEIDFGTVFKSGWKLYEDSSTLSLTETTSEGLWKEPEYYYFSSSIRGIKTESLELSADKAYNYSAVLRFYVIHTSGTMVPIEATISYNKPSGRTNGKSHISKTLPSIVQSDPEIIDPAVLSGIVTAAGNVGFEYAAAATSYVISGFDSAHNGATVTYDIAGDAGATATITGGKLSISLNAANFSNLGTDVSITIKALSSGTITQTLETPIVTHPIKTRYGADTGATPVSVSGSFGEGTSISISPLPASVHHSMSIQLYSGSNAVGSPIAADSSGATSFSVPSSATAGTVLTAKVTPKLPGMNNSSAVDLDGQYIVPLSVDPFALLGSANASVSGAIYTLSGLEALNEVAVTYTFNKESAETPLIAIVSGGALLIPLNANLYSEIGSEVYITVTKIQFGALEETNTGIDTKKAYINFMGNTSFPNLSLGRNADDSGYLINGLNIGDAYDAGFSIGIRFYADGAHVANGVVGPDGSVSDIVSLNAGRSTVYIPGMIFDPGDEIFGELVFSIPGLNEIIVPLGGGYTIPYSAEQLDDLDISADDPAIEYAADGVYYVLDGLASLNGNWLFYNIIEIDDPSNTPTTAESVQVVDGKARIPLTSNAGRTAFYSLLGRPVFIDITKIGTTATGGYEEAFVKTTATRYISFDISTDIDVFKDIKLVYDYTAGKFKFEGLLNPAGVINQIPANHKIRVIIKYDASEYATGYIGSDGYFVKDETTGGGVGLFSTLPIAAGGVFTADLTLMISSLDDLPVGSIVPYTVSYGILTDYDDLVDTLAIEKGRLVSKGLLYKLFGPTATEPLPGHTVEVHLFRKTDYSPDLLKTDISITFDAAGDGVLNIDQDDPHNFIGIKLGDELTVKYLFSNDLLSFAYNKVDSKSSAIAKFGNIDNTAAFEALEVVIEDESTVVIPGLSSAIGLDSVAIAFEVSPANGYTLTADIYNEGASGLLAIEKDVNISNGTVDISQLGITVGDRIELRLGVKTRLIYDWTLNNLEMAPGTGHLFAGMTRDQVIALTIGANSSGQIAILDWPADTSIGLARITAQIWMKAILSGDIANSVDVTASNAGVLVEDSSDGLRIGDNIGIDLEFKNPIMSASDNTTWSAVNFPIQLHGVLETEEQVAGLGLDIGTDGQIYVTGLGAGGQIYVTSLGMGRHLRMTGPSADWQALNDSISIYGSAYLGASSISRTNRQPFALGSGIVLFNGIVENATNNLYDLTADKAKIGDVYGAELLAQRGAYLDQAIPGLESAPVTFGSYLSSTAAEIEPDLSSSKIYIVNGGFGSYDDWQAIIADYPNANMIFEAYKTGAFVPVFTRIFDANTGEEDFVLADGKLCLGDMLADLDAKYGDEFTFFITLSNGVWLEDGWALGKVKVDMYNLMKMHGIPENSYVVIYDYDSGILGHSFLPQAYKVVEGKFNFFRFTNNQVPQVKVVNVNKFRYGINTIKFKDWYHYADIESVSEVNLTRSWFTFKFIEGQYASAPAENNERTDNIHKIGVKTNFMNIGITAPTYYHSIRAFAGNGGSITPSGVVSVPNGGNQSFIIKANEGYAVQAVIIDGVNRGAMTAFTFTDVASDHSIVASFVKVGVAATPEGGAGGLPSIIIPTIPATGSVTLAVPAALMILMGVAVIPKRRK